MQTDRYGNVLSTQSAAARDHYDQGVALFLAAEIGAPEAFRASIEADPGFALGHAGLARAAMMAGDMPGAKASIARASELAPGTSDREQRHIRAMSLLLSGQAARTRALVLDHAREYPRDVMAVQLCCSVFGLIGFSGEVGREAALLAYTSSLMPHYAEDWWMMSMHALALCETGQLEASERLMTRSLDINPRNANAAHFRAHERYESGATEEGRAYLTDWLTAYDARAVMHGHLSWHCALWALEEGETDAMWAAVDEGVAPGAAQGLPLNVLTDTASILYRAELAGVEVAPERWRALSDYAAKFFPETGQSFADMHAALSHAMAGDGDRLAYMSETAKGFAGDLIAPVARAWGAIARQDWSAALNELTPVMATTERLGGSRAQRDLLELAYANVLLRLGQADEAARSLQTRRPILGSATIAAAGYA